MIALYRPGRSLLHRMPAGVKLAVFAVVGTALFFVAEPLAAALAAIAAVIIFTVAAGPAPRLLAATLRPFAPIIVIIAIAQAWLHGMDAAVAVALRLIALFLLASIVTMTTSVSAMIGALEYAMRPLAWLGVDTARISMAMALAIRFIPRLAAIAGEVREAQRARGVERSLLALAVPLIVRTLKTGEEVAEALDARGFGGRQEER